MRSCRELDQNSRFFIAVIRRQRSLAEFLLVPAVKAQLQSYRRRAIPESRAELGHPDGRCARVRKVEIILGIVRRYPRREDRDEHVHCHYCQADHSLWFLAVLLPEREWLGSSRCRSFGNIGPLGCLHVLPHLVPPAPTRILGSTRPYAISAARLDMMTAKAIR